MRSSSSCRWFWLAGVLLGLVFNGTLIAENTKQEPATSYSPTEGAEHIHGAGSNVDAMLSKHFEETVQQLNDPRSDPRLPQLLIELESIHDPDERERLRQLLEQRVDKLQSQEPISAVPSAASSGQANPEQPPLVYQTLLPQIESLSLGPGATVEDLRARDQLVAEIASIRDPILRDRLLTRLEEKEREGQR